MLENKDAFLAKIAAVPLGKEAFEKLVASKQTDLVFKECIIKHHGANLMTETVANQICSERFSISRDIFHATWEVLDLSKKKKLMLDYLDILNADDFELCFSILGKPYHELSDRSRRHKVMIPYSEEHMKLAKRLQQVDYITSYDDTGYSKEYDSSSHKMVDTHAILCRVKAIIADNK